MQFQNKHMGRTLFFPSWNILETLFHPRDNVKTISKSNFEKWSKKLFEKFSRNFLDEREFIIGNAIENPEF